MVPSSDHLCETSRGRETEALEGSVKSPLKSELFHFHILGKCGENCSPIAIRTPSPKFLNPPLELGGKL